MESSGQPVDKDLPYAELWYVLVSNIPPLIGMISKTNNDTV